MLGEKLTKDSSCGTPTNLPSKIFAKEDDPSDPNEVPNNFVIYSLGLLNTNRFEHLKEYFFAKNLKDSRLMRIFAANINK